MCAAHVGSSSSAPFRARPGFCEEQIENILSVASEQVVYRLQVGQTMWYGSLRESVYSFLHRSQEKGGGGPAESVKSSDKEEERESGNMESVTGLDMVGER